MLSCVSLRAESFASTASSVYAISMQDLVKLWGTKGCRQGGCASNFDVCCLRFSRSEDYSPGTRNSFSKSILADQCPPASAFGACGERGYPLQVMRSPMEEY